MLRSAAIVFFLVFSLLSINVYSATEDENMVNVIITFDVKQEKMDSFLNIMSDVKKNLVNVDGCQGVSIYNHSEDSTVFTLVETWETKEKHSAHIAGVVSSGDWDFIASHLEKDPVSGYFSKM